MPDTAVQHMCMVPFPLDVRFIVRSVYVVQVEGAVVCAQCVFRRETFGA